jgi:hypothetical protein
MKEIQISSEGNPRKTGRKSKLNPTISFAESSLFNDLHQPPGNFSFLEPLPTEKAQRRTSPVRPGSLFGPSVFVFGSSDLFKQAKGRRRFHRL